MARVSQYMPQYVQRRGALIGALLADPRHYQIIVLSSLILLGTFHFAFQLPWWHVVACISSTVATQFVAARLVGHPFDVRSPLISALSLTLLLRTGSVTLSIAAGFLAISSKYLIRWRGKHIFNPANFGLVILSLLFTGAWISPGQWGTAPIFALFLLGMGGIVTGKAKRWDVSLTLLASYAALIFGRALWLGDPLAIPVHQMQSGALLIFAFFMISDPKTTPDARLGRVLYAVMVATLGFIIQFAFYNAAGIILALILTAPIVPLIDMIFKDDKYQWPVGRIRLNFSSKRSGVIRRGTSGGLRSRFFGVFHKTQRKPKLTHPTISPPKGDFHENVQIPAE